MKAMTDVPFDQAADVVSIGIRLHPIDVGFSVKAMKMLVDVGGGDVLRASYERKDGERYVAEGARAQVIAHLRKMGYRIKG